MNTNNETTHSNAHNHSISYFKEITYRQHNKYFKFEVYLSYYAVVLLVVGTICNTTSFLIMMRRNIRKYACMHYLSALAISDMIILYQWNLNTVFKYNLSKPPHYHDLEELSLGLCRFISFMAFSSLQISSWLLTLVSFDRAMLAFSVDWKARMYKTKKTMFIITLIVCIIIIFNSHLLVLNGYIKQQQQQQQQSAKLDNSSDLLDNDTTYRSKSISSAMSRHELVDEVVCYKSHQDANYIFPKWETAHLVIYNAIPFVIMLVCNTFIIYKIKIKGKLKTKMRTRRQNRMSFILILVTFTFMCLTTPSVIVHTFLRDYLQTKSYRRLINMIVNNLLHTSHTINFFLYVFFVPMFRKEFLVIFDRWRIRTTTRWHYNNRRAHNNRTHSFRSYFIKSKSPIEKAMALNDVKRSSSH